MEEEVQKQGTKNQPKNQNPQPQTIVIEEKITKLNGEVNIKKYNRGKKLGVGGFATCYEVTCQENDKVLAAKIIKKNTLVKNRAKQKVTQLYQLISQIKIHKSLCQKHIVQFEHVFEDHENVYILLQLCSNQTLNDLFKRRKRLKQIQAQCYAVQIIDALKYLHQKRVIHREYAIFISLKLGNLFLNQNMEIKLGDFGLATKLEFQGQKKKTVCGTPNYIAPQILQAKGHSYQVDIWSLGIILYTQLIGKPPFQTPDVKATYKKIRQGVYSFPEHVTISQTAKNLIQSLLILDSSKRLTLDQILQSPFLTPRESIPPSMPRSTLACPPSSGFIEKYTKQGSNLLSSKHLNFKSEHLQQQKQFQKEIKKEDNLIKGSKQFKSSKMLNNNIKQQSVPVKRQIIVKKWVDYSSKYGLGYLLTNGATGVYFNDSTKILLDPSGQKYYYMQKNAERNQTIKSYSVKQDPQQKSLKKKFTLMLHFKSYLFSESKSSDFQNDQSNTFIYVKKWMKTRHALMFRLNNKIVQVNFSDKTQIMLSSEQRIVIYINRKQERSEYPLMLAMQSSNLEMTKRLKYTKQILTHMLTGSSAQIAAQRL